MQCPLPQIKGLMVLFSFLYVCPRIKPFRLCLYPSCPFTMNPCYTIVKELQSPTREIKGSNPVPPSKIVLLV